MMTVLLLVLSVLFGVILGRRFGSNKSFAKSLLVVSAGFLITVCLNEVFPEVYASEANHAGIWIIGGVLLQLILENLTKGFEHGHFHHHSEEAILPAALMFGMFIHAFIEGIPLATEKEVFSPYVLGIVFHNLPISFILGAFLLNNKKFTTSAWATVALFALASPLGMLVGNYISADLQFYFLALVGGIFLHISAVIIFESNKNHNISWSKIVQVVAGILLALIFHQFHSH